MSDGFNIGGFFSGAMQSLEQNIEGGVEGIFKSNSSGTTAAGEAHGSSSLGGFDIGALFNMGGNGIMGELFAKIGGNELGIIGNLFQGNTNPSQQGNGYAPPSPGTYVPPPPPGNTGSGPCGALPHRDGPSGTGPNGSVGPNGTVASTGGSSLAGTADPRLPDAIAALETLMMNFNKCSSNGQMTPASLEQAAWDPSNPSLQQAAKFFTNNPDMMRQLFTSGGVNGGSASFDQLNTLDSIWTSVQKTNGPGATTTANLNTGNTGTSTTTGTGLIGTGDTALIAQLEKQIAQLQQQLNATGGGSASWQSPPLINPDMVTGGAGGLTNTASTGGTAASIAKLDDGIAGYQSDIEKQISVLNDPKSTDAQRQAAQSQIQVDTMKMQGEMDALKQLFEMLSNMEKAYSDICMNAISNMR